ncbi:MAG TPA: hypothetical protein VK808_01105, partial [Bacteroidia bacterium]|nr:hypothetical protein [Bacteroidia bacterium]
MNTGKKNLRNIIILLVAAFAISLLLSWFFKSHTKGKDYAKQRALFAYFIDKSVHTKDYFQFNTFIQSCRNYTDSLPPSEIDSLETFLGYYMKFNDDVYTDIINSVKDSGMI